MTASSAVRAPFNFDISSGKVLVADGGANVLWLVDRKGNISTIGVRPRHPQRLSAAVAQNLAWTART